MVINLAAASNSGRPDKSFRKSLPHLLIIKQQISVFPEIDIASVLTLPMESQKERENGANQPH